MVTTWFIDTNVIASWVIVESNLLSVLSGIYHYPSEYQKLYSERYEKDVEFVNILLDEDPVTFAGEHEAFISFLSSNELFSAIRDEVLSLKLFNMGVPVSQWPREKNRNALNKKEVKLVYETSLSVWDRLFNGNISLITDYQIESDANYWDISSHLLFNIKNIKTQDVMLITTAIMNGADYFVTRDIHLIGDLKDFLKENDGIISVIKPETATLKYNELSKHYPNGTKI